VYLSEDIMSSSSSAAVAADLVVEEVEDKVDDFDEVR
jgi:hypothetical protein